MVDDVSHDDNFDNDHLFNGNYDILDQENLDWSRFAERAGWLASKSEATVASLLSMAGQVMILMIILRKMINIEYVYKYDDKFGDGDHAFDDGD